MKTLKLLLVVLAMLAMAAPATAGDDVEIGLAVPFDVASTIFSAGTPLPISGRLLAVVHVVYVEQSVPLPNQDVDILVDGVAVKRVSTNGEGIFTSDLVFDASQPQHWLSAVAYSGTAIETHSREILVTINRFYAGLVVSPSSVSIPVGGTVQLTAIATDNDGREEDVTEKVLWTTSNPGVGTVDNSAGTRGLVTGVAPGTVTITAKIDAVEASSSVTVLGP